MKGSVGIFLMAILVPILLITGFLFYQGTAANTKATLSTYNISDQNFNRTMNQTDKLFSFTPRFNLLIMALGFLAILVGAFFAFR